MNRKLKALGLALFAAFALSAVGASAASADKFISAEEKTILTSDEDTAHIFTALGTDVTCNVTNFSGTQNKKEATEITITPTYDDCKWGTDLTAEVRTNHCGFIFTSETTEHDGELHAQVEIECENEEEQIEIEIPSFGHCNVTVPQQKTTKGVTYKNEEDEAGNKDVTVKVTAEVTIERDSGSFLCNLLSSHGTGVYEGTSTLTGYEDEGTPTTGNGTVTWTDDETATTEGVGTTHWDWSMKEGPRVDIEVEST